MIAYALSARSSVHPNVGQTLIRPRILLTDDHLALLEAEIALLSPYFEVVGTAADGAALVSKVHSLNPDVVVTDITMPVSDGIDAVHKLRESGCTVAFVFLTVHSEKDYVDASMRAGALGYANIPNLKRPVCHHFNAKVLKIFMRCAFLRRGGSSCRKSRAPSTDSSNLATTGASPLLLFTALYSSIARRISSLTVAPVLSDNWARILC